MDYFFYHKPDFKKIFWMVYEYNIMLYYISN